MSTVPAQPDPALRGTRQGKTRGGGTRRRGWWRDGMRRDGTRRRWMQGGGTRRRETPSDVQRRCWPLAVTGVALLAISVVMMTVGA